MECLRCLLEPPTDTRHDLGSVEDVVLNMQDKDGWTVAHLAATRDEKVSVVRGLQGRGDKEDWRLKVMGNGD